MFGRGGSAAGPDIQPLVGCSDLVRPHSAPMAAQATFACSDAHAASLHRRGWCERTAPAARAAALSATPPQARCGRLNRCVWHRASRDDPVTRQFLPGTNVPLALACDGWAVASRAPRASTYLRSRPSRSCDDLQSAERPWCKLHGRSRVPKPKRRGGCRRRGVVRNDWRTATAVTPSRWQLRRQLGCRAEAGPCQLHTKVSRRLIRPLPRTRLALCRRDALNEVAPPAPELHRMTSTYNFQTMDLSRAMRKLVA